MGMGAIVFVSAGRFSRENPGEPFEVDEETGQVTPADNFARVSPDAIVAERQWIGNSAMIAYLRDALSTHTLSCPFLTGMVSTGSVGWVMSSDEMDRLENELAWLESRSGSLPAELNTFVQKMRRLALAARRELNPIAIV